MNSVTINKNYTGGNHKAQRFTMRLAIVNICMTFAGFTSYFLVRKAAGDWTTFALPSIFWMSTLVIVFSSMAIQMAHMANKRNNVAALKLGLIITLLLGATFCVFQWLGWQQLLQQGVFLSGGNDSGGIFYVITGAHAVHVIGGLFFISIAVVRSFLLFNKRKYTNTYMNVEDDKLRIRTDLITVYWHFMGVLWLYLFVFLYLNH